MESVHVSFLVIVGGIFGCDYLFDNDVSIFSDDIDDRILLPGKTTYLFRQVINKTLVRFIENFFDHRGSSFIQG